MPSIGPFELIMVLVIALVILGPKRLPMAARSIGRGMREFRAGLSGSDDDPWATLPSGRPPDAGAAEPSTDG
jgi:sec-independent protein translocase protein TatA